MPVCIGLGVGLLGAALPVGRAHAQLEEPRSCSEVHAYCLRLYTNGTPPPPPEWTCEANRCVGLKECLSSGFYRMGTQYGHHTPRRTNWGPFDKK